MEPSCTSTVVAPSQQLVTSDARTLEVLPIPEPQDMAHISELRNSLALLFTPGDYKFRLFLTPLLTMS